MDSLLSSLRHVKSTTNFRSMGKNDKKGGKKKAEKREREVEEDEEEVDEAAAAESAEEEEVDEVPPRALRTPLSSQRRGSRRCPVARPA